MTITTPIRAEGSFNQSCVRCVWPVAVMVAGFFSSEHQQHRNFNTFFWPQNLQGN